MFRKITALLLTVSALSLCFSSCTSAPKADEPFYCAVSEMPQHFDPQIARTTGERLIAVNTFDGLFKLGENGEIEKCAAESYSVSENGLVYSFTLRDDLTYFFSDSVKKFCEEKETEISDKVTAADFAYGITRGILPETDAPYYALLSSIKNADRVKRGEAPPSELGIEARDSRTLVITLERRDPELLYALTQPVSFPCSRDFFELTKGRYGLEKKYTLTNGAFYLSSVAEDKSVRIAKNAEYKGAFAASPSSVTFTVNADNADTAKKIGKGDYDCGFVNSDYIGELGKKVQKEEIQNISFSLLFNIKNPKMQNALLRSGLIACIDPSEYSDFVPNIVPPHFKIAGQAADSGSIERIPYSIDTARSDMKNAFAEMKTENLTVELLCLKNHESVAKSIVNGWQKNIGVELNGTVTAVSQEEFNKKARAGEYDIILAPLFTDSEKAADFLSIFTTDSEYNFFGYSSEEYDRLVSELRLSPDSQKLSYCQSYLLKNGVVLPLRYESTVFALAKGVTGVYFSGDSANIYFYKGMKK